MTHARSSNGFCIREKYSCMAKHRIFIRFRRWTCLCGVVPLAMPRRSILTSAIVGQISLEFVLLIRFYCVRVWIGQRKFTFVLAQIHPNTLRKILFILTPGHTHPLTYHSSFIYMNVISEFEIGFFIPTSFVVISLFRTIRFTHYPPLMRQTRIWTTDTCA